jgi:hypothetical protein
LWMTMRRFCGRSTSEIRWLRNDGLQARRQDRLISGRVASGSQAIASEHRNYQYRSNQAERATSRAVQRSE